MTMHNLSTEQIRTAFQALGLQAGDIVFVHSSLRSIGTVDGGAAAVVDALLDILGPAGTLAVPTFIFSHGKSTSPVLDPVHDASEMGIITETVRTRPGARRSYHLLHSVAALGAKAAEITSRHGPSAWAADGPFWKFYEMGAKIMLLGVPYLRCTYFHMLEQMVQVPYRWWRDVEGKIHYPDGSEGPLLTRIFYPKPNFPGNDFNKLGAILEARGLVCRGGVGNAVTRIFSARAALETGLEEYRKDPNLFVRDDGNFTALQDGVLAEELDSEKSVFDPALIYPRSGPKSPLPSPF
ncbi:MAG: AAC(3) family N-acetyltransferase [Chloroflexi bacterium]|nr:AAC(3) family N-acetyltransferase [Chloroflexota bacterium]